MKNIFYLVLVFFPFYNAVLAEEKFEPHHWSEGLHLFAGVGPSSTKFDIDFERSNLGIGAHLKTDLSYVLNDQWSVDWTAGVDFNKLKSYLSWNSLFTMGVRYRIDYDPLFETRSGYVKAFIGRAPTVVYFSNEKPAPYVDNGVGRVQLEGVAYGFTLGRFHKTDDGLVWYHEFTGSIQKIDRYTAIKLEDEVPIVVDNGKMEGTVYGAFFTVGLEIF